MLTLARDAPPWHPVPPMSELDTSALEAQMASLESEIIAHAEELRVVRQVVDELRDTLEWISRNPDPGAWQMTRGRRIVSMPLDPTAADFAERINAVSPDDLPEESGGEDAESSPQEESSAPIVSDEPRVTHFTSKEEGAAAAVAEARAEQPAEVADPAPQDGSDDRTIIRPGQQTLFRSDQSEPACGPAPTAEPAAEMIPETVRDAVAHHVHALQDFATRLEHAKRLGGRDEEDFWDDCGETILAALKRLAEIAELARQNGVDLEPLIEDLGGIPTLVSVNSVPIEELRDRLLSYLQEAGAQVGIRELRRAMGYPGVDRKHPRANPVNDELARLREEGLVTCFEPDYGEPRFSIPVDTSSDENPSCETAEPGKGELPAEALCRPYNLDDHRGFWKELHSGQLNADEVRSTFVRLRATKDAFVSELVRDHNAPQLKALAYRFGCLDANRNTKRDNASAVYRVLLQSFAIGQSITYQPLSGETFEDAVAKIVQALTDEDVASYVADCTANREAHHKAETDPETLEEFRICVSYNGEETLTDEQLARFDQLRAEQTRAQRAASTTATVERIESTVGSELQLTLKEGWHDRRQVPLWIVQLLTRVDQSTYSELKKKAAMLRGWWSSFKKADSGFQFLNKESAEKFAGLLTEDADRRDELAARTERKQQKASDHLLQLAGSMEDEAEQILTGDAEKLKNTVRRAEMAAGMRGRAYATQSMAGTMRRIAAALESGEALYLDGVRSRTHVEQLVAILRRAKTDHNRKIIYEEERDEQGQPAPYQRACELESRPFDQSDIRFAKYPHPTIYRGHLADALAVAEKRKGLKQRSRQMKKYLADKDDDFLHFREDSEIEALKDFLTRCSGQGIDVEWMNREVQNYDRMRRMNIFTEAELRCALRELLPHIQKKREDDPVQRAEKDLIGKNLPGFFPTPRPLIDKMLQRAFLASGDRVLEPSCGKGDILDALAEHCPNVSVTAIELNRTLQDVLEAKGHDVQFGDFLEHDGRYDKILMNPPFERGLDATHVRHAYDLLAPGGRLVAIMSAGPFFRSDTKSEEFRKWLNENRAEVEELPDDAFKGVQAFRETGVRTRMVVIEKPEA